MRFIFLGCILFGTMSKCAEADASTDELEQIRTFSYSNLGTKSPNPVEFIKQNQEQNWEIRKNGDVEFPGFRRVFS